MTRLVERGEPRCVYCNLRWRKELVAQKLFLIVRTVIYMCLFMWLWVWLVPRWIGVTGSWTMPWDSLLRWFGLAPLLLGAGIAINCFANFVSRGKGTPAPFDAPRRLVVSGPYRYVRNPMYVGAGLFLAGCAILFADFSATLLWYVAGLIVGVNLLVLLYEEPILQRQFGEDYVRFRSSVPRWIPHSRAGREGLR